MVEFVLVSLLSYNFPAYFSMEQELNASIIIDQANTLGEDPYFMVALAWVESRLQVGKISHTGDYGIFQINYRFWGKQWGYKSRTKFLKDMSDTKHATVAATTVLKEMRKYSACRGLNLPACYNGGPGWQKSKNKEKIMGYATAVHRMRNLFRRRSLNWGDLHQ
jgi:hypothetical protein